MTQIRVGQEQEAEMFVVLALVACMPEIDESGLNDPSEGAPFVEEVNLDLALDMPEPEEVLDPEREAARDTAIGFLQELRNPTTPVLLDIGMFRRGLANAGLTLEDVGTSKAELLDLERQTRLAIARDTLRAIVADQPVVEAKRAGAMALYHLEVAALIEDQLKQMPRDCAIR